MIDDKPPRIVPVRLVAMGSPPQDLSSKLRPTVEAVHPERPSGWPIVAVVACAILAFAFIGWCAGVSDDVAHLKRRVDQLEGKSR